MRLSKASYWADYFIYAGIVAAVSATAALRDNAHNFTIWMLSVAFGCLLWTFIEYVVHRYVFHEMPAFSPKHLAHHDEPLALIGTPTWISLAVITIGVFLPFWAGGSLNVASGVSVGVMAGFFCYGLAHHAIHHRRPRILARNLITASRRHAVHHYSKTPGNFGVTTLFWDRVFGTVLSSAAVTASREKENPALEAGCE